MAGTGKIVALIKAMAPGADPSSIEQAVADWLDDHPEATTTVEDGSITEEKLASDVLADLAEIEELKEAIENQPEQKDSTATGIDLDVSDEDGNVILRLKDGHIQTKEFDSTDFRKEKVVTVKKSGGDFSTLRDAIESITDASKDNPYRIEIYPGTYNVFDDYTQAEIEEADVPEYHQGFVGPMLTDGMSLVGVGNREEIIINGTLDTTTYNATIRGNVSTLNIAGNGRLENLTVVCKYLRYCVHDDFYAPNNTEPYDRVVKNCRFDMQRNVTAERIRSRDERQGHEFAF